MPDDVNYQSIAPDPVKSCASCKHYQANDGDEDKGECFGHKVASKATCNYFEAKQ